MTSYGVKVSKVGKNVTSATPTDYVMNSDYEGTIKFLAYGSGSKAVSASSTATETISYTWSGGRPLVLLFVELTPASGRWYIAPFNTTKIGTEDTYISESVDYTYVTGTDLYFKIVNTTANNKTVDYYYYVIGETGK